MNEENRDDQVESTEPIGDDEQDIAHDEGPESDELEEEEEEEEDANA